MKSFVCALLLASVLGGPVCALAPHDSPDAKARRLMAQCRAASGGAALDRHAAFHETGTIVRDGKPGTYEVYADLHALRTSGIHIVDGKVGAGGFDGTTAWRQDSDGKITRVTDPKVIANARSEAYFTIGAYNWPDRFPATFRYVGARRDHGKDYEVVEVTPQGGIPAQLWLDRRTHRLARFTVTNGPETGSGEIWDNRWVDGTLIGFRNRQVENGHVMTQALASLDYVPLDPKRLAAPASGN
jgi:hypothetical protein